MIPPRILLAAIVLFLFYPALAEQPAPPAPVPAKGAKAEARQPAQPPALTISGPHEDAARHLVRTFDVRIGIKSVAFLPDGRSALIAGVGGIAILNLSSGQEIRGFEAGDPKNSTVMSTAISRDGRYALAGKVYLFELWDIANARNLRVFKGHKGFVSSLAFSPDGRRGLSGGDDGRLVMWDLQSGQVVHDFTSQGGGLTAEIHAAAITPDGRFGLTGGGLDAPLQLWDLQTGQPAVKFEGNKLGSLTVGPLVSSLAIFPNGRTAITGGTDNMLYLWDLKTGKQLRKIAGNTSPIGALALSRDGRFAVSGNSDLTLTKESLERRDVVIKLWSVQGWKELHAFGGGLKRLDSLAFSPDGRFILSGGMGDKVRLWDASEWTAAGK